MTFWLKSRHTYSIFCFQQGLGILVKNILHVAVGFLNLEFGSTLWIGSYDIFSQLSKHVLFLFEFFFLKISYYEPYFGTIYVASYVVGVYITLLPLRSFRRHGAFGQLAHEIGCDLNGVEEFVFSVTRMEYDPMKCDSHSVSAESLIFNFSDRFSIQCIGESCSKLPDVKILYPSANFLIWGECELNLSMLNFWVIDQVMNCIYDLGYTRFIICTQKSRPVRSYDVVPNLFPQFWVR